ncbi:alkaline phosphatase PafA [Winogradskyella immobilis]|uniref:Alkaline phosphatase family protein n=1 Tax=Winogradskyella immobilis TaxID=2816852 RepID=A0ABS8ENF7_9FLAO|nr:alkaline phosphatase PafA [Winogradskyella immobilis]MCC1484744.1 alkaline phosphatase family protein [Winogradskyella immobilis]MCG0016836.1 alkaline phosphatase family protein [Winogradskyella immobilis]
MKNAFLLIIICFSFTFSKAQSNEKPKLVVGIVVDQMRYDYLTRFDAKYGNGGFKRMMNEGFNCKNNHFNYIPTYTGPGHAAVYTGTTPKYHGIISNNWYDKVEKKSVYCVNDDSFNPVGTEDKYSRVSPNRMTVTTVTDQLRLHTQQRSKVIGIAMKDRGAVLPAGHSANAAYWFQGKGEGNWVTSSYYMEELPQWVKTFNDSKVTEDYLKPWNTLLDINTYTESGLDLNNFENGFRGKESATFPYDLKALSEENNGFDIIKSTPYGNSLTTDFAIAAIDGEDLGKDNVTDFLAISYSSTDYVGHNFGVNAKETEDTYLRLDKDLERLFTVLDTKVGKGNYTVFLTADHAAADVPSFLQSQKIAAGYYDLNDFRKKLNVFLARTYGASDLLEYAGDFQIFLNRAKIKSLKLNLAEVQEAIVNEIIDYKFIDKAYSATAMRNTSYNHGIEHLLQNGYHQKRSGDVLVVLSPSVISYSKKGTTHGSGYTYDTHVPLLLFGKGIKQGETLQKTRITDIAPTISALLNIAFPNAATGQPLGFVLD